jgi:hypothetical protein
MVPRVCRDHVAVTRLSDLFVLSALPPLLLPSSTVMAVFLGRLPLELQDMVKQKLPGKDLCTLRQLNLHSRVRDFYIISKILPL